MDREFTLLGVTFNLIMAIVILLVWIAVALWPANLAARKGHSFWGFFIFSLFFFPFALLTAFLVKDRSKPAASAPSAPAE
jgi:hypothetical protein